MKKFLSVFLPCLIVACVLCFFACQEIKVDADVLKDPSFDSISGTRFEPRLALTITNPNGNTDGCVIRYTTSDDLSVEPPDPTEESPVWEGATLDRSTIVKARAFAASYTPSGTVTASFYRVWTKLADMPEARCNHAMVAVGNYVYVIGGFNDHGMATDTVFRYDTVANTWITMDQKLKEARARHAAAVVGQKIFVFGGYNHVDPYSDSIEEFDLASTTPVWLQKAAVLIHERADFEACVINNAIFLPGGYSVDGPVAEYHSFIERYNTTTNTSETTSEYLPSQIAFHCLETSSDEMFIFGGMGQLSVPSDYVYSSDVDGNWSACVNKLGKTRYGHASASAGDFFVFGGVIGGSIGNGIERMTPPDGAWKDDATFTVPITSIHSKAVECNGRIYFGGGASEDNGFADYTSFYQFHE